ncbi:MAG TPA: hypothetical protein DEG71_11695 [Clostridiales bacterium]|nr:hypothetical protein [Clostridiales bacterium]
MDIEKNDGSTSAVDKFDSKLQIELKLSKEELANIKDKRKAGVYYIDENGNLEFMGGHFSETGIVFETGHFSNYTIVEYNKTFDDISTHWAKDYVEVVAARHIVNGMTETTFEPDTKLTRAQLATILGRTFEIKADQYQNRFKDVPQGEYYTDYVIKMSELGIIKGYEDGTFRPNDQVTREQLVVLMMRAYRYVSKDNTTINAQNTFSDMSEIADYAKSDVNLAKAMNMISGVGDNEFNPKGNSTRAETSKLIVELLKKLKKL